MSIYQDSKLTIYSTLPISPEVKRDIELNERALISTYRNYCEAYRNAFIPSHYRFSAYLLYNSNFRYKNPDDLPKYKEVSKLYQKMQRTSDHFKKTYEIVLMRWEPPKIDPKDLPS